ncbi:unnamed protein product [Heterobilharzia americana]|nr:unnamed protein product [Heterobilharzia americana]
MQSRSYKDDCVIFDDDFPGYSVNTFSLADKYQKYIESIIVPNGMIKDSLLVKRRSDCSQFPVDFVGFEIPNRFIVGYAIDYNDFFRDIPHICSINNEAKKLFAVSNVSTEK